MDPKVAAKLASLLTPPSTTPPARPQARRNARRQDRPRLDQRYGHLPRLYARRPLRLAAEDPANQLVPLRLRLLRQSPFLEHRAPASRSSRSSPSPSSFTTKLYRRLFLSSGVVKSPDHTMEELLRVAGTLRARPRLRRLHPSQGNPRGQPLRPCPAGRRWRSTASE